MCIFVTYGLTAPIKATSKAFRKREGFWLAHIRHTQLQNTFSTNNLCERLNGEFKDRIMTVRGFKLKPDKKTDGKLRWMSRPVAVACRAPQLFQTPRRSRRQYAG